MTDAQETREGIIFVGRVEKKDEKTVVVHLFIEEQGQEQPVGGAVLMGDERYGHSYQLIDVAFQGWIKRGLFRETISNPQLLEVLAVARQERLEKRPWYILTHRFLLTTGSANGTRFILTTDKSDLTEEYQKLADVALTALSSDGEKAMNAAIRKEKARQKKESLLEQLRQAKERIKFILEELPKDLQLQQAFQEAKEGKRSVTLCVKGFRPMYEPAYPYGFNAFCFSGYDDDGPVPVPTVCILAGIDPQLVQDAYFYFRNDERWPITANKWKGKYANQEELDKVISEAQNQVVTNLFPFPWIEWRREDGSSGGSWSLGKLERKPPFLSEEEIRQQSLPGKTVFRAFQHNSRKESKAGKGNS